jgi:hypothetical protein
VKPTNAVQPTPRNHVQTASKPQDLTIYFSFKMTDLTGFILAEIAGSSSSDTSNIVQVIAVTAAWQKDMMETLLQYHQLQAKLLAAAISIGVGCADRGVEGWLRTGAIGCADRGVEGWLRTGAIGCAGPGVGGCPPVGIGALRKTGAYMVFCVLGQQL